MGSNALHAILKKIKETPLNGGTAATPLLSLLHGKAFTVYPILSGGLFCSSCFARTLDARAEPHAHNPQKTPRTGSLGGVKKKSPS